MSFDDNKQSLGPNTFRAGNSTCGTNPQFIDDLSDWPIYRAVTIRNQGGTDELLYVGAAGHSADGFVLRPGEDVEIFINSLHELEILASASAVKYSWLLI
jgi:hypothetical protein